MVRRYFPAVQALVEIMGSSPIEVERYEYKLLKFCFLMFFPPMLELTLVDYRP